MNKKARIALVSLFMLAFAGVFALSFVLPGGADTSSYVKIVDTFHKSGGYPTITIFDTDTRSDVLKTAITSQDQFCTNCRSIQTVQLLKDTSLVDDVTFLVDGKPGNANYSLYLIKSSTEINHAIDFKNSKRTCYDKDGKETEISSESFPEYCLWDYAYKDVENTVLTEIPYNLRDAPGPGTYAVGITARMPNGAKTLDYIFKTQGQTLNEMALWNATNNIGLIHYWKNDNLVMPPVNDSFGKTNLTLNTGTVAATTSGIINGGLQFTSGSVNASFSDLDGTKGNNFTIGFWLNSTNADAAFKWMMGGVNDHAFYFGLDSNKPDFALGNGATWSADIVGTALTSGRWHFITLVNQDGVGKIYVNGVLNASGATFTSLGTFGTLKFGWFGGGGGSWNGVLDEMFVYNYSLSANQILDRYNNGLGSQYTTTFPDVTAPTFLQGTPVNLTIWSNQSAIQQINATDETQFGTFVINDTVNFAINQSGYFKNITTLSAGFYWINVTINDSSNNKAQAKFYVNVTAAKAITALQSSPANNANITISPINFQCNFTSTGQNISKIHLNIYNSSNALAFSQDNSINKTSYNQTWVVPLIDDRYNWSCSAFGDGNMNITTSNKTLLLLSTLPGFSYDYQNGYHFGKPISASSLPATVNYAINERFFVNATYKVFGPSGNLTSEIFANQSGPVSFTMTDYGGYSIAFTATDILNNYKAETVGYSLDVVSGPVGNAPAPFVPAPENLTTNSSEGWLFRTGAMINDAITDITSKPSSEWGTAAYLGIIFVVGLFFWGAAASSRKRK